MEASYKASPQLLKILLDNGAHLNTQNKQGNTALMIASGNANLEAVKFLLDNKAIRTIKNNNNQTAKDINKEQMKNLKDLKDIGNYIEIFDLLTPITRVNCK